MTHDQTPFNILDHPLALEVPDRLTDVTSWHGHIPFAFCAVQMLAPELLVELGTWKGDSYCAFAQAVATLGLPTRCYAVDTWEGDEHTGSYNAQVLDELRDYHDARYGAFSSLLQSTFDDALSTFDNGSIDLLHIDGCHSYEAVRHDFDAWVPKMSERGVVLLHDTAVREGNFGVWRLWDELEDEFPTFAFAHSHGLGVVLVGAEADERFRSFLLTAADRPSIPSLFRSLGSRIELIGREQTLVASLSVAQAAVTAAKQAADELHVERDRVQHELDTTLLAHRAEVERQRSTLVEHEAALAEIYSSLSWRITKPLRGAKDILRRSSLARRVYTRVGNRASRPAGRDGMPHANVIAARRAERRYVPLVSVVMPVFNTDSRLLTRAVRSVTKQTYARWELCICDDGSTNGKTLTTLSALTELDPRVSLVTAESNQGIAGATNLALEIASGEFVAFLDHDDELAPDALDEFVDRLNARPDTDVIYSDEDKLSARGINIEPHFKPDWSPEFFRGVMYVGHLLLVRRSLLDQVGGLDPSFDGVQDYELMLRLSERTERIEHIPRILYHWRATPGSVALSGDAKSGIPELQAAAVNAHLERCGVPALARPSSSFAHRVELHPKPREDWPPVSIVVPTKDSPDEIGRCLDSIFGVSRYPSFEVIVVDSGTTDPRALEILASHEVRVVHLHDRFNFSRANNVGVRTANGKHVILLNNDTEVMRSDWLQTLVWHVELAGVGAVGPLLVYGDGSVQHAGVALGARGTADHVMAGFPGDADGYAGSLACTREVSAVTAACMIVPRDVYSALGGLSEDFRTHYQDVDFCLRLREEGLRVLFTPRTRLRHDQGVSRGDYYDHLDRALLLDRWGHVIAAGDPYYSRNLSIERLDYSIAS
jgi:GT2 family glycosyltransferase